MQTNQRNLNKIKHSLINYSKNKDNDFFIIAKIVYLCKIYIHGDFSVSQMSK